MNTYQSTPDFYKEYIQHYGIKGMKWKRRKAGTNLRDRGYGTSFGNGRLVKKGFVFTHDYDNRSTDNAVKRLLAKKRQQKTDLRSKGFGTSFGNGRLVKKGFVFTHDYDNRSNNVNKGIEAGRERVKKKKRTN